MDMTSSLLHGKSWIFCDLNPVVYWRNPESGGNNLGPNDEMYVSEKEETFDVEIRDYTESGL